MSKLSILYNVVKNLKKHELVNTKSFNLSVVENESTIFNLDGLMSKGKEGYTTEHKVNVSKDDVEFNHESKTSHGHHHHHKKGCHEHKGRAHGKHFMFGKKHSIKKVLCFIKLLDLMELQNNEDKTKNLLVEINQENMPEIKSVLEHIQKRHQQCSEHEHSHHHGHKCHKVVMDLINNYRNFESISINASISEDDTLKDIHVVLTMSNDEKIKLKVNALAKIN